MVSLSEVSAWLRVSLYTDGEKPGRELDLETETARRDRVRLGQIRDGHMCRSAEVNPEVPALLATDIRAAFAPR